MKNHQGSYHYQGKVGRESVDQRRSFKYMVIIILLVIAMLVIVLFHINQYVQLSRKNLRIEELKERRNQLKTETAHLRLKVSRLMSLQRIERLATKQLNMKDPEEINYVVLKQNKSEGKLESKQQKDKATTSMAHKKWSDKLISWFNNFANVQADTLD